MIIIIDFGHVVMYKLHERVKETQHRRPIPAGTLPHGIFTSLCTHSHTHTLTYRVAFITFITFIHKNLAQLDTEIIDIVMD